MNIGLNLRFLSEPDSQEKRKALARQLKYFIDNLQVI